MTLAAQIEVLESLAALDASLKELSSALEREQAALAAKRTRLSELEAALEHTRARVAEMERLRNDLTVELRQMSQQLERSREKMGRSRTEREVQAVQRELEELRKLQRDREHEIAKLTELIEQARKDVLALEADRGGVLSDLGATSGAVETELGRVQSQVAEQEAARAPLPAKLPPAVYRRYEMVRKKRDTALAHTTDGKCSACHIMLPPMAFHQLRRARELDQCPNCARILYYRVPAAPAPEAAADG